MEGLTPRYRPQDLPSLARGTDHARILLNRARLALAALAVVLAIPVGLVVGLTYQEPAAPVPAVRLAQPAPMVATTPAGPSVGAAPAPGLAAAAPVVSGPFGPVPTAGVRPVAAGLAAGVLTVAICWMLLLVANGVWRSRLAAADSRAWTTEWTRIEPLWSRRAD